jgi:hypothetical protein
MRERTLIACGVAASGRLSCCEQGRYKKALPAWRPVPDDAGWSLQGQNPAYKRATHRRRFIHCIHRDRVAFAGRQAIVVLKQRQPIFEVPITGRAAMAAAGLTSEFLGQAVVSKFESGYDPACNRSLWLPACTAAWNRACGAGLHAHLSSTLQSRTILILR